MNGTHNRNITQHGYALLSMIILINLMLSLVMMLVMAKMHQKKRIINQAHAMQVRLNTLSGAHFFMKHFLDRQIRQPDYTTCLFGIDRTEMHLQPRGLFYDLRVNSNIGQISHETNFMVGTGNDTFTGYTIILTDHVNPLIISEKSSISGSLLVDPQQIIRTTGSTLSEDYKIRHNETNDNPVFRKDFVLSQWNQLKTCKSQAMEHTLPEYAIINLNGQAYRIRAGYSGRTQNIENITVTGPGILFLNSPLKVETSVFLQAVTIVSEYPVVFGPSIQADNLLVFAPQIEILGATLSGQFIAGRSIHLMPGTRLYYPSALVLMYASGASACQIRVAEQCEVQGMVVAAATNVPGNFPDDPVLSAARDSRIEGLIYAEGYVALEGSVTGSIIAPAFYHFERPTVYLNRIESLILRSPKQKETRIWPVCISGSSRHTICEVY